MVRAFFLVLFLSACASARGPAPRLHQATAGSPNVLGPGIIDAWPNWMNFHLTRPANVAVVRVWKDDEAQLVYPVRGATWEIEVGGGRHYMPLRFTAGWHRIDLALPLDALAAHRRIDLPDHYLLLLAAEAPLDTAVLNDRLEALGTPQDTGLGVGVAYVQRLAQSLAPDSLPWSAYVVNPCHRLGGVQTCQPLSPGPRTR